MPRGRTSVWAYDKDNDMEVFLADCATEDLARQAAAAFLPVLLDGRLRNDHGQLSGTNGEPFDWIRLAGPGGKVLDFTSRDLDAMAGRGGA